MQRLLLYDFLSLVAVKDFDCPTAYILLLSEDDAIVEVIEEVG